MDEVAIHYNLFGCGVMTVDGGASIDMTPRTLVIGPPNHAWELTVSAGDQPMHVWSGSRPASAVVPPRRLPPDPRGNSRDCNSSEHDYAVLKEEHDLPNKGIGFCSALKGDVFAFIDTQRT